jgi:hypothetical protein
MRPVEAFLAIEDNRPCIELRGYVLVAHDRTSPVHGAPVRIPIAQQLLGSCEPVGVVI